jgi:hypothetical protein
MIDSKRDKRVMIGLCDSYVRVTKELLEKCERAMKDLCKINKRVMREI